jgi:hypothetical protein
MIAHRVFILILTFARLALALALDSGAARFFPPFASLSLCVVSFQLLMSRRHPRRQPLACEVPFASRLTRPVGTASLFTFHLLLGLPGPRFGASGESSIHKCTRGKS